MADEDLKLEDKDIQTPVEGETEVTAEKTDAKEVEVPAKRKKSKKRAVSEGQVHVLATFNNTIITVSDTKGNVLTSASAGGAGFRGSKKGTAYAAQIAAEKAISDARSNFGLSKVDIIVKGIGLGREAAIRSLVNQKVQVDNVRDITPVAHGGVRSRKAKRN